jgi:hypothetical protein
VLCEFGLCLCLCMAIHGWRLLWSGGTCHADSIVILLVSYTMYGACSHAPCSYFLTTWTPMLSVCLFVMIHRNQPWKLLSTHVKYSCTNQLTRPKAGSCIKPRKFAACNPTQCCLMPAIKQRCLTIISTWCSASIGALCSDRIRHLVHVYHFWLP